MASGNGVPQQVGMAGQQRMQPGPISPSQVNYGPSVTQPPGQRPAPQDKYEMDVVGGPVEPPSHLFAKRTPTPQSGPKLAPPAGGIPQQPSVGGSRSEPFSHVGRGYSYDDYDPATNTVRHNQSGIAGNMDMGRVLSLIHI